MKLRLPLLLTSALLATFINYTTSSAADIIWKGGAGTWDTDPANLSWNVDTTPAPWDNVANQGDTAVFGGTGGTVTLPDASIINLAGLKFNVSGYTITGGTLNFGALNGSIDSSALGTGSNQATIASALTGTNGVTIKANGNLTSGGGSSSGRLILSGDNTGLTGDITITSGLVEFANSKAAGSAATTAGSGNKIVLNGGGLIRTSGTSASALGNNIEVSTGGGIIRVYGSQTLTLNGVISGSGKLTKTDSGTLVLANNSNTFTGAVDLTNGTLQLGNLASGTFTFSGNELSVASGTTLSMYGSSSGSTTHTYAFPNLAGPIKVNGGTLSFRSTNTTRKIFNAAVEFSGASTIKYQSDNFTHNLDFKGAITGTGTLTFTYAGNSSSRNFNIDGTGNNYTGKIVLGSTSESSESIYLNLNNPIGEADWDINVANWVVNLSNAEHVMKSLNSSVNAKIRGNGANSILNIGSGNTDSVFAGTLEETANNKLTVVKTGTGSLTLSGTNTYTGDTEVRQGTLIIDSADTLAGRLVLSRGANLTTTGADGYVLSAGKTLHITGAAPGAPAPSVITGNLTLDGGTFTIDLASLGGSPTAFNGPLIQMAGTLTIGSGTTFGLTGAYTSESLPNLRGSYTIIQAGSITGMAEGAFIYIYPNQAFESDFAYKLVISGNNLVLDVSEQISLTWNAASGNWSNTDANWLKQGDTNNRPFQNDARAVFSDAAGSGEHTVTITGNVSPNAISFENSTDSTYIIANNGGSLINNGAISKTGTGTVEFTGSNASYTGNVSITAGTLKVSGVNALGANNTITLTSGNLELAAAGALLNSTTKLLTNGGTITYSGAADQDISSLINGAASTGTVLVNLNGTAPVVWSNTGLDAINKAITLSGTGDFTGTINGAMNQLFTSNTTGETTLNITASSLDMSKIAGSSALTLNTTGTVALTGTAASTSALTLTGTGTFDLGNMSGLTAPASLTLSNTNITASGATYAKTLTITGSNTMSGDLTLSGTLAGTAADSLTVNAGAALTLTGDFSGYAGTLANDGTVNLGNGGAAATTTISNTGLTGTGTYVVNYSNDVTLTSAIGTGSSTNLTQAGAGKLTITSTNTSTGDLAINSGTQVQLDGTGSWAGAIKGDGTLIANNSTDVSLNNLTGNVALEHIGDNKVTLGTNAGTYTGAITLNSTSGSGTLDLANGAYGNNITLKNGKLQNAENATNLNIKASGNVDMGNLVNTSNIKSLQTTVGDIKVTGINNNLTLDYAELVMGTTNIVKLDPNTGAMVGPTPEYVVGFNSDTFTLTLDALDLNITGPLSAFLQSQRSDYAFRVTNGILGGAITTDFSKIDQNGYLEAIGYRITGVEGGYVKSSGFAADSVYRVLMGETKTVIGAGQLDAYRSVFNEGTLNIDFTPTPDADTVYLKEYAGQNTGSVLDIKQAGITAIIENNDSAFTFKDENGTEYIGTQNYGSIIGAGNIAKEGQYTHHTGGSVNITGSISAREGDWLIKGSAVAGSLDVGIEGMKATLELRSNSIISGNTTVGGDGTLTLDANFKTGTLDLETGGQMSLAGGIIMLSEEGGTSNLLDGSVLSGSGLLALAEGSTLNVGSGPIVSSDIKIVTGELWTVNTGSNLTFNGLNGTSGDSSLNIENGAIITIDNSEDSSFVGQINGETTLIKKGTGTQSLQVTNDASDINLDVQQGKLALAGEGSTYGGLIVGSPGATDPAEALINNNLSVKDLLVHSNGTLSVGAYATNPYVAKSLTVENNATFDNGSTFNTVIPGSVQGGVYVKGTLTLPNSMDIVLHNNTGITTDGSGNYPEFIVMTADGDINWADGSGIADGAKLYDAIISPGLALFITSADIYRRGSSIVADAKMAERNVLLDYADTNNSIAGANLMWNMGLQSSDTVLAAVEECIMTNIQSGNIGEAKRLMAATSGSSYVSMLSAQQAGFRYQQTIIRNRMTGMGLNQGYQYTDLPYFNAWVQGNGSYDKLNSQGDEAGFDLNTWGGTVGFDTNLTPNLTIGAAFTASYGDLNSGAADSLDGDLDMYYVNLFAQYKYKKWTHALILTGAWGEADVNRTVSYCDGMYRGHGKTDASSYGAMYELTYDIAMNKKGTTILQPLFNASIQKNKLDGFHETGAGNASLSVDNLDSTTGSISVGARVLGIVGSNIFGREAIGEARVQLMQDVGNSRATGDVGFVGKPGFTQRVRGAKIGTTGVQFGLGLTVPLGEQSSVFAEGNAELRSHSTSANGSIGYRYNF